MTPSRAAPDSPSLAKLRARLIERIEEVTNIDVLVAYEMVLAQLDYPYDADSAVEGFLAVGDLVRASRRLHEALTEATKANAEEPS